MRMGGIINPGAADLELHLSPLSLSLSLISLSLILPFLKMTGILDST